MKIVVDVTGIDAVGEELSKEIRQFQTYLAREFKNEVVPRTPIDKGRARRGWQQRSSGNTEVIENQVPYIERLERGWSRQAPNGFVKQAITATVAKSKRIIK